MCYRNRSIGIIIPAYNEELLIGETIKSIPDFVDKVVVVDDCSRDKTAEIAGNFGKKDARISCISHQKNKGVGAAITTGYEEMLKTGIDISVVMAGDNQMDGNYLPLLLDPIVDNKADYAKGNRLFTSEFRHGMSKWRVLGNILLTFLTKMSSGYWSIMDPQNGYAAITKKALAIIEIDKLYPRYGYCNDLLVKLNVYGFRVVDVMMPAKYGNEKSKIKYKNYIPRVSLLLLRDFLWRLKMKYLWLSFHPLILFYICGFILVPLGLIGGFYSLYQKIIFGETFFVKGVLSLLIFIIGIQFMAFAALFDMQASNNINEMAEINTSRSLIDKPSETEKVIFRTNDLELN